MGTNYPRPPFRVDVDLTQAGVGESLVIPVEVQETMTLYLNYTAGTETLANVYVRGLYESGAVEYPTSAWVILIGTQRREVQLDVGRYRLVRVRARCEGNLTNCGTLDVSAVLSRNAIRDPLYGRAAASRDGRSIRRLVNNKTGIGTNTILTDASVIYNLQPDERVLIDQMVWGMTTQNRTMRIELGYTSQANGAGTFTPLTAYRQIQTPTTPFGVTDRSEEFPSPLLVSYHDGARCITFRVTASNVDASITASWSGWREKEA